MAQAPQAALLCARSWGSGSQAVALATPVPAAQQAPYSLITETGQHAFPYGARGRQPLAGPSPARLGGEQEVWILAPRPRHRQTGSAETTGPTTDVGLRDDWLAQGRGGHRGEKTPPVASAHLSTSPTPWVEVGDVALALCFLTELQEPVQAFTLGSGEKRFSLPPGSHPQRGSPGVRLDWDKVFKAASGQA